MYTLDPKHSTIPHLSIHTPEEWAVDGIGFLLHQRVILPGLLCQPDRPLLIGFSPSPLQDYSFFLAYSAKFVLMIDTSCACCPD